MDDSFAKIKGEYYKDTKIFLYSSHEFNVAILLRFFDVFYSHVPPYGSYVIIELHNYGGVRGFKVRIYVGWVGLGWVFKLIFFSVLLSRLHRRRTKEIEDPWMRRTFLQTDHVRETVSTHVSADG